MIDEDVNVLTDIFTYSINENSIIKSEMKEKLSHSLLNILEFLKANESFEIKPNVKLNPNIKNGVKNKYFELLELYERTTNISLIDKEKISRKFTYLQLIKNIQFRTLHNLIIDCMENKLNIVKEIEKLKEK